MTIRIVVIQQNHFKILFDYENKKWFYVYKIHTVCFNMIAWLQYEIKLFILKKKSSLEDNYT